jgi:hypothetical protein
MQCRVDVERKIGKHINKKKRKHEKAVRNNLCLQKIANCLLLSFVDTIPLLKHVSATET